MAPGGASGAPGPGRPGPATRDAAEVRLRQSGLAQPGSTRLWYKLEASVLFCTGCAAAPGGVDKRTAQRGRKGKGTGSGFMLHRT